MTLLAADELHKSFGGVAAVRGVSFAVARGEVVALIGPNGAGKSTCFAMLAGQLRPDAGRVRLDEHDITGLAPGRIARLGIGRTFQITAAFASMTVRENVQTALIAQRGETWRLWRAARLMHAGEASALLDQVGLAAYADLAASVLAYGDLKRLELAMTLVGAPRLLLMDEPTAGMAPAERTALMRLVRRLAAEHDVAVLFTEHDMDTVFGIAERILVLHQGELIATGDADAIRADARVREVYLGTDAA
jgi:branched-chain amino acid transport system ATP-binding protein